MKTTFTYKEVSYKLDIREKYIGGNSFPEYLTPSGSIQLLGQCFTQMKYNGLVDFDSLWIYCSSDVNCYYECRLYIDKPRKGLGFIKGFMDHLTNKWEHDPCYLPFPLGITVDFEKYSRIKFGFFDVNFFDGKPPFYKQIFCQFIVDKESSYPYGISKNLL